MAEWVAKFDGKAPQETLRPVWMRFTPRIKVHTMLRVSFFKRYKECDTIYNLCFSQMQSFASFSTLYKALQLTQINNVQRSIMMEKLLIIFIIPFINHNQLMYASFI